MPTPKPLALVAAAASAKTLPDAPLVVIAVPEGGLPHALAAPQLAAHAQALTDVAAEERFVGEAGQVVTLRLAAPGKGGRLGAGCRLVLMGLGKTQAGRAVGWVRLGGQASRLGQKLRAGHMALVATGATCDDVAALAQGLSLGVYRYTAFKSRKPAANAAKAKRPLAQDLARVTLCLADAAANAGAKDALALGATLGQGVALARDWVNCPPNVLYPESFVAMAKKLVRGTKLKLRVLGPKEMAAAGMGMLLGVGQGSARPPRLLCISHRGPKGARGTPAPTTALVGKGITFDSGGLCIKTCDGMNTMKMDMGGAAAVLATLWAADQLRLPGEVHGYMALAENMPAGNALRTGDVITSALGLTVEVNNTDAEGRLVLGDALHHALKTRPDRVIDVATLTGACMVALGPKTIGLFSNDDALAQALGSAAQAGGEDIWRMPLTASLADQLKSDVADLRNTGDRYGGAITAALFLQKFVGQTPWAHLDIAGPAWSSDDAGMSRRGGTGAAVATLVRLLLAGHNEGGHRRGPR